MLMRLGTKKDNKITHPASVVHLGRKIANLRVWISGSLKFPEIILVKSLSRFWLFATPWAVAYQAPLSMEFCRQEYWSGLPLLKEPVKKKKKSRDLPGSPVVKTLPSKEGGTGYIPGRGVKIPHALRPKTQNIKQKQYCNKFNKDLMIHIKKIS